MNRQDILDRVSDPEELLPRVRRQAAAFSDVARLICHCGREIHLSHDDLRDTVTYQHGDNAEHRREFPLREIADYWSRRMRGEALRHPARLWCDEIHEYEGRVQR